LATAAGWAKPELDSTGATSDGIKFTGTEKDKNGLSDLLDETQRKSVG